MGNQQPIKNGKLQPLTFGPAPESDADMRAWLKKHNGKFGHFINGKWVKPSSGTYFKTIAPATGEVLAEIAMGNADDVDLAMKAAAKALPKWSDKEDGFMRAKYLIALARALQQYARELAVVESRDGGKPIRESRDIDIPLCVRHLYHHAGWAQVLESEFPGRKPGGVIAQIIPWNFPLLMFVWKIAPALAAGNTVVIKPAETTSLSVLRFVKIIQEVGLPPGVINIVTGAGETGATIVNHPTPWKVAFTGSTGVGQIIRKATASTDKKLTMELGGKGPFIVCEKADLHAAVEGVMDGGFLNQGHVCCAGTRILVQESVADEFTRLLKARIEKMVVGDSLDKGVDMGAINSPEQYATIKTMIDLAPREGATVWQPEGCSLPVGGCFLPPTLLLGVQPTDTVVREEIFGPVLTVMTFRRPSDAIALANNTKYGLAGSVWSQDIDTAMHIASAVNCGVFWINSANVFDASAPFGGNLMSGFGREGGRAGMEDVLKFDFNEPSKRNIGTSNGKEVIWSPPELHKTHKMLVGGKRVRADRGTSFPIHSSLYGTTNFIGAFCDANRKDVRNAEEAARKAIGAWKKKSGHQRGQLLFYIAEQLQEHRDRLIAEIMIQTGYSIVEAEGEVDTSIERLYRWAAYADKHGGTVQQVNAGRFLVNSVNEPIGVLGIRAPDDWPLLGLINSIAPAIAMGNTVVTIAGKHPLCAKTLIDVIQDSDIPGGVINLLTAKDPDKIAILLAEHEDVNAIWAWTGDVTCAKINSASQHNMKRTWTHHKPFDWIGPQGANKDYVLRQAVQVKTIWVPYGV